MQGCSVAHFLQLLLYVGLDLCSCHVQPCTAAMCRTALLSCAGKYTVFGQVIDGMEVLDRMEKLPTGVPNYATSIMVHEGKPCLSTVLWGQLCNA